MKKCKLISLVLSLVLLAGCGSNTMSDGSFPSESEAGLSGHLKLEETDNPDAGDAESFPQEAKSALTSAVDSLVEETESHKKQPGNNPLPFQPETETRTDT